MIGKIMVANNMVELQQLIMMRNQFMTSYGEVCKNKGFNFVPNNVKIIILSDTESHSDDYIVGSILLPNSRAMFNLIEGDYNKFVQEYQYKLNSDPDIQEFIVLLLAGLVEKGFDYIFYFDNDDLSMCNTIGSALFSYLYAKFGVINSNNMNFIEQSIIPEKVVDIENLIRQYKLSNRPESLFIEF